MGIYRLAITLLVLVSLNYTVQTGDTLQSIAYKFCPGSDPNQVGEFREGIRELNYDVLGENEVSEGLKLTINKWE